MGGFAGAGGHVDARWLMFDHGSAHLGESGHTTKPGKVTLDGAASLGLVLVGSHGVSLSINTFIMPPCTTGCRLVTRRSVCESPLGRRITA